MRHRVLTIVVTSAALCLGCDPAAVAPKRAFHYLDAHQVKADIKNQTIGFTSDYAGDWPQFFYFDIWPDLRYRDVSPFTVTFIHHALLLINENTVDALGMTQEDAFRARQMRRMAIECMERFAAAPGDPAFGTYGFWPYAADSIAPPSSLEELAAFWLHGPVFNGSRLPPNVGFFPRELAIPTDADTTSTILVARLNASRVDGGIAPPPPDALNVLVDWRDTGALERRLNPFWLPGLSGLYFTWLDYRAPGDPYTKNDIDLLVNANVLYAMARFDRLDAPGVAEAVGMINYCVSQDYHRIAFRTLSDYYPDNYAFQYCVSRAYHEGPLPALQPAVDQFADEIVAAAIVSEDGTAHWDKGTPHLNTAFAILTLMNAGRDTPLVAQGLTYLAQEQDPIDGHWNEGNFFLGHPYRQMTVYWTSEAFTTAMALEAFCRYRLSRTGH